MSIIPYFLVQNYSMEEGKIVSTTMPLYPITKEYLIQNSFPLDYHEEILLSVDQAKHKGETYVHCPAFKTCLSIPSHLLKKPIK
jgi:hypothetical protein